MYKEYKRNEVYLTWKYTAIKTNRNTINSETKEALLRVLVFINIIFSGVCGVYKLLMRTKYTHKNGRTGWFRIWNWWKGFWVSWSVVQDSSSLLQTAEQSGQSSRKGQRSLCFCWTAQSLGWRVRPVHLLRLPFHERLPEWFQLSFSLWASHSYVSGPAEPFPASCNTSHPERPGMDTVGRKSSGWRQRREEHSTSLVQDHRCSACRRGLDGTERGSSNTGLACSRWTQGIESCSTFWAEEKQLAPISISGPPWHKLLEVVSPRLNWNCCYYCSHHSLKLSANSIYRNYCYCGGRADLG